jgi:hypothetical protein
MSASSPSLPVKPTLDLHLTDACSSPLCPASLIHTIPWLARPDSWTGRYSTHTAPAPDQHSVFPPPLTDYRWVWMVALLCLSDSARLLAGSIPHPNPSKPWFLGPCRVPTAPVREQRRTYVCLCHPVVGVGVYRPGRRRHREAVAPDPGLGRASGDIPWTREGE